MQNFCKDEKHFLLECKCLSDQRKTFINKINLEYKKIQNLSISDTFVSGLCHLKLMVSLGVFYGKPKWTKMPIYKYLLIIINIYNEVRF